MPSGRTSAAYYSGRVPLALVPEAASIEGALRRFFHSNTLQFTQTRFDKFDERFILKVPHLSPNVPGDGQREEPLDILLQTLWLLEKPRAHRVVETAQMKDYEHDKHFFLRRHTPFRGVHGRIENARKLRLGVHSLPQVAMLLSQLYEVSDPSRPSFEEESNANQNKTTGHCARLHQCKPILSHPLDECHGAIVSN